MENQNSEIKNPTYDISLKEYLQDDFFRKSRIHWMLSQIAVAQNFGSYYTSIATGLTLPDLCSNFHSSDSVKNRYIKWVKEYFQPYFAFKDENEELENKFAEEVYYLRCRFLHQGTVLPTDKTDKANSQTTLASFLFSTSTRYGIHDIYHKIDRETFPEYFEEEVDEYGIRFSKPFYILSIHLFIKNLLLATLDWLEENKTKPGYEDYISNLFGWSTGLNFLGTGSQWFLY